MSKTLYVDVTQLVHWQGKLTGIPRVMSELSTRYAQRTNTQFITWDNASRNYVLINLQKTLITRGKKIHYIDDQPPFRRGAYFAFRVLRKLRSKKAPVPGILIRMFESLGSKRPSVSLLPNSTLIVLWGEQGNKHFINRLVDLHAHGIDLVQVAYDMLPLVTPQFSGHSTKSMDQYNTRVFPICKLILSISEYTKKDIQKWLQERSLKVPPIEVFRLGDDFEMLAPTRPLDKRFIASGLTGNDYMLCVGTIEARKNHTLLYYVYKLAQSQGKSLPKLVIVGRKGWLADNIYEIMKLDPVVKDSIVILEGITDEELAWLYKHALLTVYPSFYEGWGLPIAESIAHGTPCICSETSSMPEIAGDLIQYFSPYSADDCLAKITATLEKRNLAQAKKTIAKYKPTSWDDTFKQVDEIIGE